MDALTVAMSGARGKEYIILGDGDGVMNAGDVGRFSARVLLESGDGPLG